MGSCLVVSWCYGTAYTRATLVVTMLFFANTFVSVDVCWYRSMKQVMCDNLSFGHFASFMIMLFDCTGKILDVSL